MTAPKRSLLDYVQSIMSDMTSDPVNSIGDTEESRSIANILRDVYYEMMEDSNEWASNKNYIQLDPASDTTNPTKLIIPDTVGSIENFKYNKKTSLSSSDEFQDVQWMYNDAFMDLTDARDSTQSNVETIDIGTGVKIYIFNDRAPQYWTSFNDNIIFCDAYDSSVEQTLQASKTKVKACMRMPWEMTDTFIPFINYRAENYLLNCAKARAFAYFKGETNKAAEAYTMNNNQRTRKVSINTVRPPTTVRYGRP
jgi:hypothetical protein